MIKPNAPVFELNTYGLDAIGLSRFQAAELYQAGFLSFDPFSKQEFAGYDIEEMAFLKKLFFGSGPPPKLVSPLAKKPPAPLPFFIQKFLLVLGGEKVKRV